MSARVRVVSIGAFVLLGCGAATTSMTTTEPSAPIATSVVSSPIDPCVGVPAIAWSGAPVDSHAYDLELASCVPAGDRGWSLALEVTEIVSEEIGDDDDVPPHARGRLTLLCGEGGTTHARLDLGEVEIGGVDQFAVSVAASASDYDGDGRGELVLRVSRGFYEGGETRSSVLTCRDDTITPYEPAAAFADFVLRTIDADGDGRLDVYSGRPFVLGRNAGSDGGSGSFGGPRSLWHALPDGTFTWRDAVGRAALVRECEDIDSASLYELYDGPYDEGMSAVVERMTCALVRGETVEALRARIVNEHPRAECERIADEEVCDEEVPALLGHLDRIAAILR